MLLQHDSAQMLPTLKNILLHRLMTVQDWQERFLRQPDKPRTCHQLRVSLRASRSLLSFLRPAFDDPVFREAQDALRSQAHALASLRELDVLDMAYQDFLEKSLGYPLPDVLTLSIREAREKEAAKAHHGAQDPQNQQTILDLLAWVDSWPGRYQHLENLLSAMEKRAAGWESSIRQGLINLDAEDLAGTHSTRLTIKKLRYVLENLPFPVDGQQDPAFLKQLQDLLGDICDSHVHAQLLFSLDLAHQASAKAQAFMHHMDQWRGDSLLQVQDLLAQQDPGDTSASGFKI